MNRQRMCPINRILHRGAIINILQKVMLNTKMNNSPTQTQRKQLFHQKWWKQIIKKHICSYVRRTAINLDKYPAINLFYKWSYIGMSHKWLFYTNHIDRNKPKTFLNNPVAIIFVVKSNYWPEKPWITLHFFSCFLGLYFLL